MRILFVCIIAGLSLGAFAQDDGVEAKIKAAMAADIRTDAWHHSSTLDSWPARSHGVAPTADYTGRADIAGSRGGGGG